MEEHTQTRTHRLSVERFSVNNNDMILFSSFPVLSKTTFTLGLSFHFYAFQQDEEDIKRLVKHISP